MDGQDPAMYRLPPLRAKKKTKRAEDDEQPDVYDIEQRASKRAAGSLLGLCPTAAAL